MMILRKSTQKTQPLKGLRALSYTIGILALKASVFGVDAMETNSTAELWPENSTILGTAFQQERCFFTPEAFKKINLNINTGQLHVCSSPDQFLHIQTKGEENALNKLSFSLQSQGLNLEDRNEAPKAEINFGGSNMSFGGISFGNIGNISCGNFSVVSSIIKSGGRTVLEHTGMAMKSNSFAKKNGYISQDAFSSFGGQGSTYGILLCEGIQLKDLTMGPNGRIWSGTIVTGKVEQAGKFYGPGTSFNEGIPDKLDMNSIQSTTPSVEKIEKPQPLPTEIKLWVPKSDQSVLSLNIGGKGDSKTDIKNLTLMAFNGKFSDNSTLDAEHIGTGTLDLKGTDYGKVIYAGYSSSIIMGANDNSELKFINEFGNMDLPLLSFTGSDYGKLEYKGKGSICTKSFLTKLTDSSKLTIDDLYVTTSTATLTLSDYGKLDFTGSFDKVLVRGTDSSDIKIKGSKVAPDKVKKPHLHQKELFSTFELSDYAKVNTDDWLNKIVVKGKDSSSFTYGSNYPTESTQITVEDYAKVALNTQVNRAKINAKDSADVSISAVLDVLEDHKEDYAKIKVKKRPNTGFQF